MHLKLKHLRRRAWAVSFGSGVVGFVPVPGLSLPIDVPLLVREFKFYRDQLIVPLMKDQENFNFKVSEKVLKWFHEKIDKTTVMEHIKDALPRVGLPGGTPALTMVGEESLIFIPIAGSVVGGSSSFVTMTMILCTRINEYGEEAERHLKKWSEKEFKNVVENC